MPSYNWRPGQNIGTIKLCDGRGDEFDSYSYELTGALPPGISASSSSNGLFISGTISSRASGTGRSVVTYFGTRTTTTTTITCTSRITERNGRFFSVPDCTTKSRATTEKSQLCSSTVNWTVAALTAPTVPTIPTTRTPSYTYNIQVGKSFSFFPIRPENSHPPFGEAFRTAQDARNKPSWYSINTANGILSGTAPPNPGMYDIYFVHRYYVATRAVNGIAVSIRTVIAVALVRLNITTASQPPIIRPSPVPTVPVSPTPTPTPRPRPRVPTTRVNLSWTPGQAFTYSFTETVRWPAPISWLPSWINVTNADGVITRGSVTTNTEITGISGTPPTTAAGTSAILRFTTIRNAFVRIDINYDVTSSVAPLFTQTSGDPIAAKTLVPQTVTIPAPLGNPTPTVALTGNPSGVTYDAATRICTINPAAGTAGSYTLTFTASNGVTPNATYTIALTVTESAEPAWSSPDGGTVYLLKDVALSEDKSTNNAVIEIPQVDAGDTPITYRLKAGVVLPTGLAFSGATRKITGTPTEDTPIEGVQVIVEAVNAAGTGEYTLTIVVRQGVAPVLPIDDPYDFPFIVGERSILRLPGVTNPTTVYPPPVYALSTVPSKQGPAASGFNAIARTVDGVATEAEETATAETSASIVMTATNVIGSDDYTQKWKAVTRPVGEYLESGNVPDSLLDQIKTPGFVMSGLAWIPDTAISGSGTANNGSLLILDGGDDTVYSLRFNNGVWSRDLRNGINQSSIRNAYRAVFGNIQAAVIVPTGITYIPSTTTTYILDSISGHIFAFRNGNHAPTADIAAATVTSQIDARIGGEPQGLTYDGRYLRVAVGGDIILSIDPVSKKAEPSRSVDEAAMSEAATDAFVTGVAWDGKYFLCLDSRSDGVYGFLNGRYDGLHDIAANIVRRPNLQISPTGIAVTSSSLASTTDDRSNNIVFIADAEQQKVYAYRLSPEPVEKPPADFAPIPREPAPLFIPRDNPGVLREALDPIWPGDPPRQVRIVGCTFDEKNDVLYVVNQFAKRQGTPPGFLPAFRNGVHVDEYDVDVTRMPRPIPRIHGATVLPGEKYGNILLVLDNRAGAITAFYTGTKAEQAEQVTRLGLPTSYDISEAEIAAAGLTGSFTAITFDYDTETLYVGGGVPNKAYAFVRNSNNTAWSRAADKDIDIPADSALTYDSVGLLTTETVDGNISIISVVDGERRPLFNVTNQTLRALADNINPQGLGFGNGILYIADRNNKRVWSLTRRIPERPSTTTLIYSATGLPPGMNLNPLTRTVAGTPAYGSAGNYVAVFVARNTRGFDTVTQEITVHSGTDLPAIRYSASGLPSGVAFDSTIPALVPNGLPTLPPGVDVQTGIATILAENEGGSDTLLIPWRITKGDAVSQLPSDLHPHPEKVQVQWPHNAERQSDITEFLEGCIQSSTKVLELHDTKHDTGPQIRPSHCSITFEEETRSEYITQPSLSQRLLELPYGSSFKVTLFDQYDNIYWRGEVTDNFQIDRRTAQNSYTLKIIADNAVLNYKEPVDDRLYKDAYIWNGRTAYRNSVVFRELSTDLGVAIVQPDANATAVPRNTINNTVINYDMPKETGNEVWQTLGELLLKSGLIMYPNTTGTQFIVERLSERSTILDMSNYCPTRSWVSERQQNSVKGIIADYAPTKSYNEVAKQNIGIVWAISPAVQREATNTNTAGTEATAERIVLRPKESWPRGANEFNIVPTGYSPTSFEPEPLSNVGGTREKILSGVEVLLTTGPHLVGVPDGVTIRRAELHGLWADLWITNDTNRVIDISTIRIEADDLIYIDSDDPLAGSLSEQGSASGVGLLELSNKFIETEEQAREILLELKAWAETRTHRHEFQFVNPDIDIMQAGLRADYIMPAVSIGDEKHRISGRGPIVRPIQITETWRNNKQTVRVIAESAEGV